MIDGLGAAGPRAAALTAWSVQPARLREDANAEEDHARGYYRDRVVVELAQNAADAAVRAGVPGRLSLHLHTGADPRLVAANTGEPVDAAGLASMASLRASAAASGAVGRFGVGFAAVRSVADDVAVLSRSGSAHFSLARTARELSGRPDLAEEVARRAGSLPALRLPFEGPGPVDPDLLSEPWDTVVVLLLRDAEAVAQVRAQLDALDDVLLLALPGLDQVEVTVDEDARLLESGADRWVAVTTTGTLDPALLSGLATEARERPGWQVTWAVPRHGPASPAVLHAPTPTDERCTLPALLLATWPLDPSRRHVVPGPVTDALVAQAGAAWALLLLACRAERSAGRDAPDPVELLPRGWPAGPLDAALREAALTATRTAPVLLAVDGTPVAPRDAVVLAPPWSGDRALTALIGPWLPGLVLVDPAADLRPLQVATTSLSQVAEQLPADPALLHDLLDLVAPAGQEALAELATVAVPLVDGRVVHGVRGLVVPQGVPADVLDLLAGWGLRLVDPRADHPALERLGAVRADAHELARHPVVRERVLGDEAEESAEVLLALVAAAGGTAPGETWWGEVLLPAADDEPVPARGLVLPGSRAAGWFDAEVLPPVHSDVLDRWGAETLLLIGVRGDLAVEPADDVVTADLDGWPEYLAEHGLTEAPQDAVVLADLDAVAPTAWSAVLAAVAQGPARRALDPVRHPDGAMLEPYTVWWLRRRSGLGLDRPFALPGHATPGLEPPPSELRGLDEGVLRALGGVPGLAGLDLLGWADLLEGTDRTDPGTAVLLWRALAAAELPTMAPVADAVVLPALVGPGLVALVPTGEVAVADPQWAQHPDVLPVVVVPAGRVEAVADGLDLDLACERADGRVTSAGRRRDLPAALVALADVLPGLPPTWLAHEPLEVDGRPVAWWVDGDVHAASPWALGRALASLVGWHHRELLSRLAATADASVPGRSHAETLLELAADPTC